MIKKYLVETTVRGAENMWDFVQVNDVVVRPMSKVKAEPTSFLYELSMTPEIATLFILSTGPLSCSENVQ